MTILIAGATGFLGSSLLKKFIEQGYTVVALKRKSSNISRIEAKLAEVIIYNIEGESSLEIIFKKHNIDIVINTVTNYGRASNSISSIVDTNLMFGLNLLEESINNKVKAYINTDTLLDKSINAYALSKSQLIDWMKYLSNEETKIVNIKIEHMYGLLDDENKFIYWLIKQLKSNIKSIELTSGEQERDFIYIDDIVNAYISIIEHLHQLSSYEEFELGRGETIKVKTFIEMIYNALSKDKKITTKLNFGKIKYRKNENMHMIADISKLKSLGWSPKISIEDGIKIIVNGVKND